MPNYFQFYNGGSTELRKHLKPICCQSCRDNNLCVGDCKKCLENQAYNREWLETHPFIWDTRFRCYHSDEHVDFKTLPLRLPNEHNYLYYGIELEIEFDSRKVSIYNPSDDDDYYDEDDNWKIQEIIDEASGIMEGMFVTEADGSLANGVEFIFRPMTYGYLTDKRTIEKFKKFFEFLKSKGAYADQPISNGMHIHLSRKFFDYGNTKLANRGEAYQSFDWLFQKFQPEFELLGGRKYTDYCASKTSKLRSSIADNYYARSFNADIEVKATLKKGGNVPQGDHYSAVNLGRATIEARIFKSTTDYKQMYANIELVRNLAHAVREENIEKPLNEILHTKDNLFLDEHIQRVRMQCAKNKEVLNLDKMNDNKIEIVVKQ